VEVGVGQGGEGGYQTTVVRVEMCGAKDCGRIDVQGEEARNEGCYGNLSLTVVDLDQAGYCRHIVCLT
jgi:hypothetical protein